ncbi:MAG: flavin reductase family protein [Candidatus Woesearchaeota archaeon]|nr:flavin reductase family protein [Candidatus Woesearchaeota archaeon]
MAGFSEIFNPMQTVLVSSRGSSSQPHLRQRKDGDIDNIMAIDWHMPVSFKPALYAISVGKTRFSFGIIESSKVFAVNFMPAEKRDAILFCGRKTGATTDKFHDSGLTKLECSSIDCPRIKEACAFLECEVVNEIEEGDHVIFIGKVLNGEILNLEKRAFHLRDDDFTTTEEI